MTRPLVAVAHGSRSPAAQETVAALAERVRDLVDAPVTAAYVELAEPSLPDALDRAGPGAVVVPLLLAGGYHLAADVRPVAAAAGAAVAPPLGPDEALTAALADRLEQAGAPDDVPVVLAAAGSSDPAAVADVAAQAELFAKSRSAPMTAAYLSAAGPTVDDAIADLLTQTGQPVAIAPYLLAPGHFADRLRAAAATWCAEPLGTHPAVAAVVAARYTDALAGEGC